MYNTSASELESIANDLGQIARSYTSAAQELDQQVITLEGAVSHVLSDGVMQWKGLSSEAFVSAWLERRVRLKQASTLMSESATQMTTLAQTIESNIAMIRAGQSIQLQPIFATMPSNEQQSVLDGVSQAQNAIFMAVAALNSQLEAMAAEVSNCPEVDREAGTPGYYDNAKNYAAADAAEGDGTGGGDENNPPSDEFQSGVDQAIERTKGEPNRVHHIFENPTHDHLWNKTGLDEEGNWNLIKETMVDNQDVIESTPNNTPGSVQTDFGTYTVDVRYIKINGILRLTDAWIVR